MPKANGSPEFGPQDQLTAMLYTALEQGLDNGTEVGELRGCAFPEAETVDLSFVPEGKKIVLFHIDPGNTPDLYYAKNEGYDPRPFLMPGGQLELGEEYKVSSIARTDTSVLEIRLRSRHDESYLFFTNSLDGLELKVVDKSEAELANELIYKYGRGLEQHDQLVRRVEEIQERIKYLPEFPLDSPNRYNVDLSYGGTLYAINYDKDEAVLLQEFGPRIDSAPMAHGKFKGNRLKVIDGKLLVVDDELEIGLGAAYQVERDRSIGFAHLGVNNLSGKAMNKELLARSLEASPNAKIKE